MRRQSLTDIALTREYRVNATMSNPQTLPEAGIRHYHIWSKTYPSPNRRYEGIVWGQDPVAADQSARRQFGAAKVYDVQGAKWGNIVKKG